MKFVTYESGGQPRVGVVQDGRIFDVRRVIRYLESGRVPRLVSQRTDFKRASRTLREGGFAPRDMIELLALGKASRKALGVVVAALAKSLDPVQAPRGIFTPLAKARLLAPISRPGKITCVGLNYADHAKEQNARSLERPIFFLKGGNTICGPGDPIRLPVNSTQIDYEAEFAVVIGKKGRLIPEEKAYEYVAGYMILNDVSARDMQYGDRQWFRGKSCDTFGPTGPWIVTPEEIPDPQRLRISLTLNGEKMQDSNTAELIYKIPFLISYLSQSLTWEAGDILATGTPGGVGHYRQPPRYLQPGDTVSVSVEGVGTLCNPVVGP
ncbi:MAG TPA: fumarylacetoacetate hydrolase family protein [Terriglobia bacterium]|nr:fumarylacetoacetate hydrolase family protein [Terriglobia bacterium]